MPAASDLRAARPLILPLIYSIEYRAVAGGFADGGMDARVPEEAEAMRRVMEPAHDIFQMSSK